jgi:hypothetical protein
MVKKRSSAAATSAPASRISSRPDGYVVEIWYELPTPVDP